MPEPIVPALIPQGALAPCPVCGLCVLVRVWMPLKGWGQMTAPLVPTEGDWHWCVAPPRPAEGPPPDGGVTLVPQPGGPLEAEPAAPLPAEDDPLRRGVLLRAQISDAVHQSGRPVDRYWQQTCQRCRVQAPGEISVPWLEDLLAECEAVLAKQAPSTPAVPPEKRPRKAQVATTPPPPPPTPEPPAPAPTPVTPQAALAAGEESWRVTLVTLAIGSLDMLTDTMDAALSQRVQTAARRAQAMAEAAETTADQAHEMCEVLGQLQTTMAGQLGLPL
jgi:hypothetical protein